MWNRVKRVFKKKRRDDKVISFDGGRIGLKDVTPFKLEPSEEYPSGVPMNVEYIGTNSHGFSWKVNGKRITADDILEAQRKYIIKYGKENDGTV